MTKLLITGSTGFLGQNLLPYLPDAITPSKEECNLLSDIQAEGLMIHYQPDIVIHLAAVAGGIGLNQNQPATMLTDNLLINLNVFEACRIANVKKIITIGSVCAYPKFCPVPFLETDIWNGKPEDTNAPYGESKRVLMQLCETYRQQYGMNTMHLIPTNMYGRFDNFNPESSHVIPALIQKIDYATTHNQNVIVWGTGKASRDFVFVDDVCQAIISAIDIDHSEPINIGSGVDTTITQLVNYLCDLMEFDGTILWDDTKPDGQPKRQLDITRAKNILNWQPTTDLRAGLWHTVKWYYQKRIEEINKELFG